MKNLTQDILLSEVVKTASKNIASKIIKGNTNLPVEAKVLPLNPTSSTLSKSQGSVVPSLDKTAFLKMVNRGARRAKEYLHTKSIFGKGKPLPGVNPMPSGQPIVQGVSSATDVAAPASSGLGIKSLLAAGAVGAAGTGLAVHASNNRKRTREGYYGYS